MLAGELGMGKLAWVFPVAQCPPQGLLSARKREAEKKEDQSGPLLEDSAISLALG
jgi:hypothetical protein